MYSIQDILKRFDSLLFENSSIEVVKFVCVSLN